MDSGTLYAWQKCINLVNNRVKVINDMYLAKNGEELAGLDYRRGYYRLKFAGAEVCKAKVYDLEQAKLLLAFSDGLKSGCWHLRRIAGSKPVMRSITNSKG